MRKLLAALAVAIVTLGTTAAIVPAHAEDYDRRVRLINETDTSIVEFHASNVGTNVWEENILDGDIVTPGHSTMINLDDGTGYCKFDFLTVLRDGQQLIKRNVNVCEVSSYRIHN
jgi:hypothetical protein